LPVAKARTDASDDPSVRESEKQSCFRRPVADKMDTAAAMLSRQPHTKVNGQPNNPSNNQGSNASSAVEQDVH
jgi:hypothetical protein